jgi:hypothetical protein
VSFVGDIVATVLLSVVSISGLLSVCKVLSCLLPQAVIDKVIERIKSNAIAFFII